MAFAHACKSKICYAKKKNFFLTVFIFIINYYYISFLVFLLLSNPDVNVIKPRIATFSIISPERKRRTIYCYALCELMINPWNFPSFLPSTYVTLSITPAFPFLIVPRDRVALINNQNIQTKRNNFHFKSQNGILFVFFSFVLFVLFNFNLFFF